MANNYYRKGEYNALCDSCGFKFKASDLMKRWDGLMVDQACWEARQPQDLIRAVKDPPEPLPWTRSNDGSTAFPQALNLYVVFNYWEEINLGPVDQWYVAPE